MEPLVLCPIPAVVANTTSPRAGINRLEINRMISSASLPLCSDSFVIEIVDLCFYSEYDDKSDYKLPNPATGCVFTIEMNIGQVSTDGT
jgi:hypothetical protein